MELKDIRDGDTVRLRNGEAVIVGSKTSMYRDREGEHEGPFVTTPPPALDHYPLSDVVGIVTRNERVCRLCGEGVTSRKPDVDFCEGCHYTGRAHEDRYANLIGRLTAIPRVAKVSVWHTGGGCFLLAVTFDDGRLATMDSEFALPEEGEPWTLIVVAPNQEAWDEWDEDRLDVRVGEWTQAQLVAEVFEIAESGEGSP